MTDHETVARIERAMARNLQDYVSALASAGLEGAWIRVGGGVAAFTGMDTPLSTVKGAGPELNAADLDRIEAFFASHAAPPVVEAAPWLTDASQRELARRGYEVRDQEDVVVAQPSGAGTASTAVIDTVPLDEWEELIASGFDLPRSSSLTALLRASWSLPGAHSFGLLSEGSWVAGAQTAAYPDHRVVVFGNDATRPSARGRGAHAALIQHRVSLLPDGHLAVAEVEPGSGSERNYLRCGFAVAYARSHWAAPG